MQAIHPRRATAIAFLTALVTLSAQILTTRIVSAKLLSNYAFFVISLSMLGFALSGTVLTRRLDRFLKEPAEALSAFAALFTLSFLGATAIFYRADVGIQTSYRTFAFVADFLSWLPLAGLYAVPFMFCGLILGTLLSSPELPTGRVYFADLAGSALGAFGVITGIRHLGVETSVIALCAALTVGVGVLLPPKRLAVRVLAGFAVLAVCAAAAVPGKALRMRYPRGSMLEGLTGLPAPYGVEDVSWDPLSRVEVSRVPPPNVEKHRYPLLIGSNREFHSRFKRIITQNNWAYTDAVDYDGTAASLKGIEETIYAAAYEAATVPSPRVAIIGVGGGFDVLTALNYDAAKITAVEVNEATVRVLTQTYRAYFQHWVSDPRVALVNDEGRHFMAANEGPWDIIQLSGVDTFSGTPGAANIFSETYLYTAEALALYLQRLSDDGVLNMMRLEHQPAREMLKALVTAVQALRQTGVARPAEHVVTLTARNGFFSAMLVKKRPFREEEIQRLEAWAQKSPYFSLTAAPGRRFAPNLYQSFLAFGDPAAEQTAIDQYTYNIAPATDDAPFFFRFSFWRHLLSDQWSTQISVPVMEASILVLTSIALLVALICVLLPLRQLSRKSGTRRPQSWRWVVYFGGIGLGYMAIEFALLQKFGLLLGHPNYSLSVVLSALLLSTGVGSLAANAIVTRMGNPRFVSYLLSGLIVFEYAVLFPLIPSLIQYSFAWKALFTTALVVPIGVLLGTFFPIALGMLKRTAPELTPWAWGVNGIFSVVAPLLGVVVTMSFGFNALLLAAIPVYLIAVGALPATETPA